MGRAREIKHMMDEGLISGALKLGVIAYLVGKYGDRFIPALKNATKPQVEKMFGEMRKAGIDMDAAKTYLKSYLNSKGVHVDWL